MAATSNSTRFSGLVCARLGATAINSNAAIRIEPPPPMTNDVADRFAIEPARVSRQGTILLQMIQPIKSGRALLDEIESTPSPTPTIWWLGHSGFVLKY